MAHKHFWFVMVDFKPGTGLLLVGAEGKDASCTCTAGPQSLWAPPLTRRTNSAVWVRTMMIHGNRKLQPLGGKVILVVTFEPDIWPLWGLSHSNYMWICSNVFSLGPALRRTPQLSGAHFPAKTASNVASACHELLWKFSFLEKKKTKQQDRIEVTVKTRPRP